MKKRKISPINQDAELKMVMMMRELGKELNNHYDNLGYPYVCGMFLLH